MKKQLLFWGLLLSSFSGFSQTSIDPGATAGSTGSVSFTYNGSPVTLTTVRAADGNVWLQQNLGSTQVATADNDALSYGHYFQWGRWDDGHQLSTSTAAAASTLSANNPSGLGIGSTTFYTGFWTTTNTTDTWSASAVPSSTSGKDPCIALGTGWHLPTGTEFASLYTAEGITSAATAFASNLKLVKNGYRTTSVTGAGALGAIWTATTSASAGNSLGATYAGGPVTSGYPFSRANGLPCRCMKVAPPSVGCTGTPITPTITTAPTTICSNNTVNLVANNTNTATGITLQWQESTASTGPWANVTSGIGATTLNYTTASLTANKYFRIVATCTASTGAAPSNSVLITVNPSQTPSIAVTSDAVNNTACTGTTVTFTATPTNGGTSPSYQWLKGSSNVGTNSTTYSDNALTSTDIITCVLTSNATCLTSPTATSNAITTTMTALVNPDIAITANPASTICDGDVVTFTATQINGGAAPSYQWFVGNTPTGVNSTYSYTPANGDAVSCVLTGNAVCASVPTDTSNVIAITVHPLPAKPSITTNGNVLMSSAANGNQWFRNNTAISGAVNQTYTITSAGHYQVEVTDGNTCSNISDSSFAEPTTAIHDLYNSDGILVYPTPFSNNLFIDFSNLDVKVSGTATILNQVGQKIFTTTLKQKKEHISLSELASGMYFLSIDIAGKKYSYKIVKQ